MHLRAWSRWQHAAGPWNGWAICPVLTMPDGVPASKVQNPIERFASIEPILEQGGAAVVLDLQPVLGVRIAAAMSHQQMAYVVLVLPRWPHCDAVLPVHELLGTLVATSRYLRQPKIQSNVLFVLDAGRQKSIQRHPAEGRVDNRYSLSAGDLPNLATLRSAGIGRVVRLVQPR